MPSRQHWFFLIIVAFSAWVLEPLWLPLTTGMVLAYLSEGPVERLWRRAHAQRQDLRFFIALLFVCVVSSLFIAPLIFLSWSATNELLDFWKNVNGDSSALETGQHLIDWVNRMVTPWIERTGLDFNFADITTRMHSGMEPFLKNMALKFADILSGTPAVLLFVTVGIMAWVYFLVHGKEQRRVLLPKLIPWPAERDIICNTMGEVLRALVLTSVVLSIVQSILVIATLGLAGIPKFYLWGALAFFLSFIPVFGTAPVMIGAAIYAFTTDHNGAGVVILCMSVFIGSIDNIIRPILMKGSTELSFFWLFMALVGGIAVFGLAGAVLGPWAFAMFSAIIQKSDAKEHSFLG
ncbi:MAG: AI-2E family transporter [Oligoflexus sp.]|nr:AI-2E family transporter [Oligoflexus sp.]